MAEALPLLLASAAGMALGAVFFGGLWWTVRVGVTAGRARPALFLGSLALRLGATLAGFHLVAGDDWIRLLGCLLGFTIARVLVLRIAGPPRVAGPVPAQEAGDAP